MTQQESASCDRPPEGRHRKHAFFLGGILPSRGTVNPRSRPFGTRSPRCVCRSWRRDDSTRKTEQHVLNESRRRHDDTERQAHHYRLSTVPHGLSVKGGSEVVSATVTQTRGAIGYVELTYAVRNGLAAGAVQNSDGEFVRASVVSISAAADAAVGRIPRDLRVSITNAPGKGIYPPTSFTWLLLYENADRRRSRLIADFIKWALSDGQALAPDLGYAPLPPAIVSLAMEALGKIKT